MKWVEEITSTQKIFALIAAVSMAFGWMFLTFETISASETKWDSHAQVNICGKVADARVKIAKQKSYIKHAQPKGANLAMAQDDIAAQEQKIKTLDPDHRCRQ